VAPGERKNISCFSIENRQIKMSRLNIPIRTLYGLGFKGLQAYHRAYGSTGKNVHIYMLKNLTLEI
jgi:hypothetical protein